MTIQATIFTRAGFALADIDGQFPRSWKINDVGECSFMMATTDAKCSEQNLRYGNLLLVQSDRFVPWVGVIDTPRNWAPGIVTVKAYSAERILKYRRGSQVSAIKGTPGNIFDKIIATANAQNGTQFASGEVYYGGSSMAEKIDLSALLAELQRICVDYGREYDVTPALDANGRLTLTANFYLRRGAARQIVLDNANTEAADNMNVLSEQGDIFNDVLGYGNGLTWASKGTSIHVDSASQALYDVRQTTVNYDDDEQGSLDQKTTRHLQVSKKPRNVLTLSILDAANGWDIRLGDVVPVQLVGYGFLADGGFGVQGQQRVTQLAVDEVTGRMLATLEQES